VKKLLLAFYRASGNKKPERLVFYRDGVSEGQARAPPPVPACLWPTPCYAALTRVPQAVVCGVGCAWGR
jgi:hypothetical protein